MIKEGKKRVTATLEKDLAAHLQAWENYTNYTKSDIINFALRYWFTMKGDTFDGWER